MELLPTGGEPGGNRPCAQTTEPPRTLTICTLLFQGLFLQQNNATICLEPRYDDTLLLHPFVVRKSYRNVTVYEFFSLQKILDWSRAMGRALEKRTAAKVVFHPGQLSLPTKSRQQRRQGTAAVCRLENQLLLAGTPQGFMFFIQVK
jgi:hypothetical protein